MADNINLLPEQTEVVDGKSKQNALINKISAGVLVVTIVAVAGVLGYNFLVSQNIASLDAKITDQSAQVGQYKEAEGVYRSAAMRLDAANQFLTTQNHYSRALSQINKVIPGGVKFTMVDLAGDKTVTVSGTATTYGELSGFLAKLKSSKDAQSVAHFMNPTVSSISRSTQSESIKFTTTFKLNNSLVVGQTTDEDQ